jgi:hypothetical protein
LHRNSTARFRLSRVVPEICPPRFDESTRLIVFEATASFVLSGTHRLGRQNPTEASKIFFDRGNNVAAERN